MTSKQLGTQEGASLAGVPDESGPSPAEIAVNFDRARRKKGLR